MGGTAAYLLHGLSERQLVLSRCPKLVDELMPTDDDHPTVHSWHTEYRSRILLHALLDDLLRMLLERACVSVRRKRPGRSDGRDATVLFVDEHDDRGSLRALRTYIRAR